MVVIPFTYLRPGLWELRCCGDILSDFLGLSWQHTIQLQVLPTITEVSPDAEPTSPEIDAIHTDDRMDLRENLPFTSEPEIAVEPTLIENEAPQLTPLTTRQAVESDGDLGMETENEAPQPTPLTARQAVENDGNLGMEIGDEESASLLSPPDSSYDATPLTFAQQDAVTSEKQTPERDSETLEEWENIQPNSGTTLPLPHPLTEIPTLDVDEAEALPLTLADQAIPLELAELDNKQSTLADGSAEVATPTNPILEQSLQMLEQILQQVLDPVMQDFQQPEPSEPEVAPESERSLEIEANQQGFILTLDEESLVARRGEPLTISGQVDILDVNQLSSGKASSELNAVFQGTLCYELRDPQSSRVLLHLQQPLPEQSLPLAFCHTLEIPPDCPTRLILGKVSLYSGRGSESISAALASQPFSVAADLEELLGAIIPGTRAMPVAKMLVPAKNPVAFQESQDDSPPEPQQDSAEAPPPPLKQPLRDWVELTQNRQSPSFQPSSGQTLPPQIYQPSPTSRRSKSLELPNLPKLRPITESAEFPSGELSPLVISLSESEEVEAKQEDLVERLLPLALTEGSSSATLKFLPEGTAKDTVPESLLQDEVQQSEEAILQRDTLQLADSLASDVEAPKVSDSPVPVADSLVGTVPSGCGKADAREVHPAELPPATLTPSNGLETPEHEEFTTGEHEEFITGEDAYPTTESPLAPSQETDALASDTTIADSWFDDSVMTVEDLWPTTQLQQEPEAETQPTETPPVADTISAAARQEWVVAALGESEPATVDNAFQALNIQDRFWSRLNSLLTDAELSQSLNSELSPPSNPVDEEEVTQPSEPDPVGVDVEEITQPLTSNTLLTDFDESIWEEESEDFDSAIGPEAEIEALADTDELQLPPLEENTFLEGEMPDQSPVVEVVDIDWAAQEFVVEDDDLPEPENSAMEPETSGMASPTVSPTPQPSTPQPSNLQPSNPQPSNLQPSNLQPSNLQPSNPQPRREIFSPRKLELPLPTPELSIPANELAAGEPVTLRVKLPPHPSRLCVKLWVQDRQSRSLLDGPRWLMDLIPDRKGEQEALTQLTVPFGSAEIRFEAIAVDIDSQRESHKVMVDRIVVPPDLPDFSLDEFK
jgi:hypothetical protein